jgi:hypothetical protein
VAEAVLEGGGENLSGVSEDFIGALLGVAEFHDKFANLGALALAEPKIAF